MVWDLSIVPNNPRYKYRVLTEFGWDIVPCEILEKPDDTHYNIEFFDNVSGRIVWETVPATSIENL